MHPLDLLHDIDSSADPSIPQRIYFYYFIIMFFANLIAILRKCHKRLRRRFRHHRSVVFRFDVGSSFISHFVFQIRGERCHVSRRCVGAQYANGRPLHRSISIVVRSGILSFRLLIWKFEIYDSNSMTMIVSEDDVAADNRVGRERVGARVICAAFACW